MSDNLENFIKIQKDSNININSGFISRSIKESAELKEDLSIVVKKNNIPVKGFLKFDQEEEDENKFQGCLGMVDGEVKYTSFFSSRDVFGLDGRDLNINLDFNNIIDSKFNNVGQIYNNNLSSNTYNLTQNLNNINVTNSQSVLYPYEVFTSNKKQQLSFKKIYFIPENDFNSYLLKVKPVVKNYSFENEWDFYADETEFKPIPNSNKLRFGFEIPSEYKFNYYNKTYDSENNDYLYFQDEGSIVINNTSIFENNSETQHFLEKRISFLFSYLILDITFSKKEYLIKNNNLIIKYQNIKKVVLGIIYYVNVQIIIALDTNSEPTTFMDNDINLKPGTIIFSYGDIPEALSSPLVGLSNGVNISSQISLDSYMDVDWNEENGFGVVPLNTLLGLTYDNTELTDYHTNYLNSIEGDKNNVVKYLFESRVNNFGNSDLNGYAKKITSTSDVDFLQQNGFYKFPNTYRLIINDQWESKYSDFDNNNEYYINILDLGELLPKNIFIATQSIFDYDDFNQKEKFLNIEYYSHISSSNSYTHSGKLSIYDSFLIGSITNVSIEVAGSNLINGNNLIPTEIINVTATEGTGFEFTYNITNGVVSSINIINGGNGYSNLNEIGFYVDQIFIKLMVTEIDYLINWAELTNNDNTSLSTPLELLNDNTRNNLNNIQESEWIDITPTNLGNEIYNSKIYKIFIKKKRKVNFSKNINEEGKMTIPSLINVSTNNNSVAIGYKYFFKIIFTLEKTDKADLSVKQIQPNNNNFINGPYHIYPIFSNPIYSSDIVFNRGFTYDLINLEKNKMYVIVFLDYLKNFNRRAFGLRYYLKNKDNILQKSEINSINFEKFVFFTDNIVDNYQLIIESDRKIPNIGIELFELVSDNIDYLLEFDQGNKIRILDTTSNNNNLKYLQFIII